MLCSTVSLAPGPGTSVRSPTASAPARRRPRPACPSAPAGSCRPCGSPACASQSPRQAPRRSISAPPIAQSMSSARGEALPIPVGRHAAHARVQAQARHGFAQRAAERESRCRPGGTAGRLCAATGRPDRLRSRRVRRAEPGRWALRAAGRPCTWVSVFPPSSLRNSDCMPGMVWRHSSQYSQVESGRTANCSPRWWTSVSNSAVACRPSPGRRGLQLELTFAQRQVDLAAAGGRSGGRRVRPSVRRWLRPSCRRRSAGLPRRCRPLSRLRQARRGHDGARHQQQGHESGATDQA